MTEAVRESVEQFFRDGYLYVPGALSQQETAALLTRQKQAIAEDEAKGVKGWVHVQMHVRGAEFEALIDHPSIIDIVEGILGDDCHIIGETALVTHRGHPGQHWHVDDRLVLPRPDGVPWDDRIRFPCYLLTAMFYLVHVTTEMGPTQVVPGSQKAGSHPPGGEVSPTFDGRGPVSILANAGDCMLFSGQVWHRGAPHVTDTPRYVTQVHYGCRWVAQRFYPFPNYHMPEDLIERSSPRRRRLLGVHPPGPYG
jgi:ectoine hydroxylase-related dioxygenase (phytanoyl-CoA dioxygenase family)